MPKFWNKPSDLLQVTPEKIFYQRRKILSQLSLLGSGSILSSSANSNLFNIFATEKKTFTRTAIEHTKNSIYNNRSDDELTPELKIISHNNFYEFGTSKTDPMDNAQNFSVNPWVLKIDGEVELPMTLSYEELFSHFPLEERIYRFRCVEAWSMVIPWLGFPLKSILQQVKPKKDAKFVTFETIYAPEEMPGQKNAFIGGGISYPYTEGLTVDEAMNDLTFLSVGLYGKTLPPQNGAPIRLVVPWKYGFKSIKSIVNIRFTKEQPQTTWSQLAPNEYGFFANVNPDVDHPRWSQSTERRLGSGGLFSSKRIPTLKYNGYEKQVAYLYEGVDLRDYY